MRSIFWQVYQSLQLASINLSVHFILFASILRESITLDLAGGFDPRLDDGGWLTQALIAQLFIFDPGYLDETIDAVKQRARYTLLLLGDNARRAGAGLDRVTILAAKAGVLLNTIAGGNM